jgi:Methyl-accepting chemotaxis protein
MFSGTDSVFNFGWGIFL